MKVSKLKVYDLEESIIASKYPMLESYAEAEALDKESSVARAKALAQAPVASGHCNFVKGILVAMDITATIKWWIQANRYSHFHIVSSMSTMHRAHCMDLTNICENVDDDVMQAVIKLQDKYNKKEITHDVLVNSLPNGLTYTARVTTNYLQLRIMYEQRKNHRLQEWKDFCDIIKQLPMSNDFIIINEKENL